MNFSDESNLASSFIIISVLVITGLILWNSTLFYERLKKDEGIEMQIFAQSIKAFDSEQQDDYLDLVQLIGETNKSIPVIIAKSNGEITDFVANLPSSIGDDKAAAEEYMRQLSVENEPIKLDMKGGEVQYVYFGNSDILNKLRYYPVVIALILFLLIGVVYFFFSTSKASEQNKLWAGMAKETAHQIGTPLSSLVGWNEILKTENVNPEYIAEIEKDISRLKVITERFSKIGSIPKLQNEDIVLQTKDAYTYLETRSSKLINFSLDLPEKPIYLQLNEELYGWTIENLVKNAIDAMKGKGDLHVSLIEDSKQVYIRIKDNGKGIPKSKFNKIFQPGYTSKTRGWGLGLSLAKRIIEDYHNGKIRVLHSEIGKGTTFQITLQKTV